MKKICRNCIHLHDSTAITKCRLRPVMVYPTDVGCEDFKPVPQPTNFNRISESPEKMAALIARMIFETIQNCVKYMGSKKVCSLENYDQIYERVLNLLNQESEKQ